MKVFFKSLITEINYASKNIGLLIILFVGMPFLSMWFTGAYYNDYVNDVSIAVLDCDNSQLSRQIVQYFDQNERFNVTYYPSTKEELQKIIDERKVYMGVYIPEHLSDNIKRGEQSQVLILTDGTNVIVGNNVYAGAAQIVQSVSAGASIQVLEGKGGLGENQATSMALPFTFQERMLYDSKLTYKNYLIYGVFAVFLQQLLLSALATLLYRNPEETAAKNTLAQIAAKVVPAAAVLMGSGAFSIFLMHKKFNLIYNGHVGIALGMSILFSIAITCPALIIFSLTKKKTRFTQIAYMLSLPTFLTCGYVWPVDQMPKLLAWLVKILWPLMNFARPFDEVMVKGLPLEAVSKNIMELILYIVVMLPVGIWMFKKNFKTENKGYLESQQVDESIMIQK